MGWIMKRAKIDLRGLFPRCFLALTYAIAAGLLASVALPESPGAEPIAHPPISLVEGAYLIGDGAVWKPLGEVSDYCRSCHGAIGSGEPPGGSPRIHIGAPDRGHPVDVPYPEAAPELVPKDRLDPAIVLVDGKMTCLSCHVAGQGGRGLTKPAENGELCRSCHVK